MRFILHFILNSFFNIKVHAEEQEVSHSIFAEEVEKLYTTIKTMNQSNPLQDIKVEQPNANSLLISVFNGKITNKMDKNNPSSTVSPSDTSIAFHKQPSEIPQQIYIIANPQNHEIQVESITGSFSYKFLPLTKEWKCCNSFGDYGHDILQFIYHDIGIMSRGFAGKRY